MRIRLLPLLATLALAGCGGGTDAVAPTPTAFDEPVDLVPEYALSPAVQIDGAGIGGARLPDELRLTPGQKAALAALHDAFMRAIAADVAALRAIERRARDAIEAGRPREEIRAILETGKPHLERIAPAFAVLQAAIWRVYTPAQREWIESHRPRLCGPEGPPRLTDDQVRRLRALQQAFLESVRADLALVRQIVEEARTAKESGKSEEEIRAILAQADEQARRIREAEQRLQEAIDALLTPEQKANRCIRPLLGPPFPPRP